MKDTCLVCGGTGKVNAETPEPPVQVVIEELARDALRQRDDYARRGYAMPFMPHESAVRAVLYPSGPVQ